MSAGAIAAEPLYLLFEKYGHITAHEKSKDLAHMALSKGIPLVDVISKDEEATVYWKRFTTDEKMIIQAPEKHYTGLAAQKTKLVVKNWKQNT